MICERRCLSAEGSFRGLFLPLLLSAHAEAGARRGMPPTGRRERAPLAFVDGLLLGLGLLPVQAGAPRARGAAEPSLRDEDALDLRRGGGVVRRGVSSDAPRAEQTEQDSLPPVETS